MMTGLRSSGVPTAGTIFADCIFAGASGSSTGCCVICTADVLAHGEYAAGASMSGGPVVI